MAPNLLDHAISAYTDEHDDLVLQILFTLLHFSVDNIVRSFLTVIPYRFIRISRFSNYISQRLLLVSIAISYFVCFTKQFGCQSLPKPNRQTGTKEREGQDVVRKK